MPHWLVSPDLRVARTVGRGACRVVLVTAAVGLGAVGWIGVAPAGAANEPAWHQATAMPFGFAVFEPSASLDGRLVAFRSNFNFVSSNPDGNYEVFLFDRETSVITQITNTSTFFGNFEPSITPDGSAVIFRSTFDFVGQNPDGSWEIYEKHLGTQAITQLTSTPGTAITYAPRLSGDGEHVVYATTKDGTLDVWRYSRASGELVAITSSTVGFSASKPSVNADGTCVAFLSNGNFDGTNPDHSLEIWRWVEGQGVTHVTKTSNSASNELPAIDGSGSRVAFISRGNITGSNPNGTREIFLADFDRSGPPTVVQVTPSRAIGKHLQPALSATGDFLLFESDRDLVGSNADKNRELFRFDTLGRQFTQITDSVGGVPISMMSESATTNYVSIAADDAHFAYRSEHPLDPRADDPAPDVNLELFVATNDVAVAGDLDLDGDVDEVDLGILLGEWGSAGSFADLDGDRLVGSGDLAILLGAWT